MAFTDRVSEYPNRYTVTDLSNNTSKTCTITRDEGNVEVDGTPLNANNMNSEVFNLIDDKILGSGGYHRSFGEYPNIYYGGDSAIVTGKSWIGVNWSEGWFYRQFIRFPRAFHNDTHAPIVLCDVNIDFPSGGPGQTIEYQPSSEIDKYYTKKMIFSNNSNDDRLGFWLFLALPNWTGGSSQINGNITWMAIGEPLEEHVLHDVTITNYSFFSSNESAGSEGYLEGTTTDPNADTNLFPGGAVNISFKHSDITANYIDDNINELFTIKYTYDNTFNLMDVHYIRVQE